MVGQNRHQRSVQRPLWIGNAPKCRRQARPCNTPRRRRTQDTNIPHKPLLLLAWGRRALFVFLFCGGCCAPFLLHIPCSVLGGGVLSPPLGRALGGVLPPVLVSLGVFCPLLFFCSSGVLPSCPFLAGKPVYHKDFVTRSPSRAAAANPRPQAMYLKTCASDVCPVNFRISAAVAPPAAIARTAPRRTSRTSRAPACFMKASARARASLGRCAGQPGGRNKYSAAARSRSCRRTAPQNGPTDGYTVNGPRRA